MDNRNTYGTNVDTPVSNPNMTYPPPYPVVDNFATNNPPNTGYVPYSNAYPPVSSAYPPNTAAYPPPDVAPPPYSSPNYPAAPQITQTTTTTVVLVNDPNVSSNLNNDIPQIRFNSKSIRLGYIRRVFAILSIQLLVTVGFIFLFAFVKPVQEAGRKLSIYIAAYVIFFVLYFVLVCCDGVRRKHPTNLILLSLFTLSLSYLVGVITSYHDTKIVLIMMGVTAAVTIGVSLFACQTKFDMTKFGGILFVFALVMFFVLIFTPAFLIITSVGKIAIGGALALLFTAFLVYDIQIVMGGRKYELSEEEYVFGALILYMDIINLFLLILYIFGGSNN